VRGAQRRCPVPVCHGASIYAQEKASEPLTANRNESDFAFIAGKRSGGLKKHMKHVVRASPCIS
jgi:hypothetical protein